MAETLARPPVLHAAGDIAENAELGVAGCSSSSNRIARRTRRVTAYRRVNLKAIASGFSPSSGHNLQTLTGLRRPCAVDALTVRSGRDFQSQLCPAVVGRRESLGFVVVAEFGEKAAELTITPAQEESGSSNGHENLSIPDFETGRSAPDGQRISSGGGGEQIRSMNFNGASDSYRPGVGRSVDIATSSSFRPGPIPSVVGRKNGGKNVTVDRWVPPGSKLNQVKQILERLEGVEPTDEGVQAAMDGWETSIYPRDIASVISNLKWRKGFAFFNWLQSQGYKLNVVIYNVLLGRFRAGKVWNVADGFGQQMISEGVKLDKYTYSTLISCALQCNVPLDALKWFDRMHESHCVPDEVIYSNMALVYSKLGRFDDAVELYERLKETGWKPDRISFGTMVNVYSRGGNYFKASAVIREMQEAGIQPEAVVYNTLIKHFAREGKTGQAKRVFVDMERAGVKPSEYTLSLMIDVLGRAGETKEAFQLFARMKEEKLPLDVVVYNSLLKMCAEERLVGEADSLLAGLVKRGLKPDVVTYKSAVNLYAKEGRIKEAEKFANRMAEAGFALDVVVYSCLMRACGLSKDFKKAATFFETMLAEGCQVDDKCCGILLSLMNVCETAEDRSILVDCLRRAKPILSVIVELLLAEDLQLEALQELVETLLSDTEIESHRPFCNALVDLCWNLDMEDRAQQLLSLADSLNVYPGGLRTKTANIWVLHLRSLSFNAAECGLHAWIHYLKEHIKQGEALPETLVIETGAGRNRVDVVRLFSFILEKLGRMGAPFEPSQERSDWITSSGSAATAWLAAASSDPEV